MVELEREILICTVNFDKISDDTQCGYWYRKGEFIRCNKDGYCTYQELKKVD